jgi:hypothetical protein
MKYLFEIIFKFTIKIIVFIWDFIFFFFGIPYEDQASKLKLDELDPLIRGTENEKPTYQIYRANKVSKNHA